MAKSKLTQVLEHLIKGEEDLARDVLHQVFIEKARAIHEEMMNAEEDHEEQVDENLDGKCVGGSGDEGKDLTNDIKAMENDIDFEETMAEDDEDGLSAEFDDEMSDEDISDDLDSAEGSVESVEAKMDDLERALEDLKAEFEKLEGSDEAMSDEADADLSDEVADDAAVDSAEDSEVDSDEDSEEDDWELDEDFDELAESLDLEVVEKDMLKTEKAEDVGAAKSGMSDGNDAKSPVPPSQTDRMGAEPVKIGKGPDHKGFDLQSHPKVDKIAGFKDDNRRKKATDGTKKMPKDGDSSAILNKTASEFGTNTSKMSILSKGGNNLK